MSGTKTGPFELYFLRVLEALKIRVYRFRGWVGGGGTTGMSSSYKKKEPSSKLGVGLSGTKPGRFELYFLRVLDALKIRVSTEGRRVGKEC